MSNIDGYIADMIDRESVPGGPTEKDPLEASIAEIEAQSSAIQADLEQRRAKLKAEIARIDALLDRLLSPSPDRLVHRTGRRPGRPYGRPGDTNADTILRLVAEKGPMTANEISSDTGIAVSTVRSECALLRRAGKMDVFAQTEGPSQLHGLPKR